MFLKASYNRGQISPTNVLYFENKIYCLTFISLRELLSWIFHWMQWALKIWNSWDKTIYLLKINIKDAPRHPHPHNILKNCKRSFGTSNCIFNMSVSWCSYEKENDSPIKIRYILWQWTFACFQNFATDHSKTFLISETFSRQTTNKVLKDYWKYIPRYFYQFSAIYKIRLLARFDRDNLKGSIFT